MQGDWHLIYSRQTRELRLYNIREDIGEQNDLARQEPGRVKEMARELTAALKDCQAQRPALRQTGELIPWPDGSMEP